jgi:hypothetical protein
LLNSLMTMQKASESYLRQQLLSQLNKVGH